MVGLEGSPLLQAPSGKPINSNKYRSQLNQLRAVLDKKCLELANWKCMIFHQDNARPHVYFDDQAKTVTACLGSSDSSSVSPDTAPSNVHLFWSLTWRFEARGHIVIWMFPVSCSRKEYVDTRFGTYGAKSWPVKTPSRDYPVVRTSL